MSSDEVYTSQLGRSIQEQERTHQQFQLITSALGFLLHPSVAVTLPSEPAIADIGTGTGRFLKEIYKHYPNARRLDGFDISSAFFDSAEFLPAAIQLHIHDVKTAFPAHLHGVFDLVHIRYLVGAMEPSDWAPVLHNLISLLKPGGGIQWTEPAGADMKIACSRVAPDELILTRLNSIFLEGPMTARSRAGVTMLPQVMQDAGMTVEQHIINTRDSPHLSQELAKNAAIAYLNFARSALGKQSSHAMTEDELREAEAKIQEEISYGAYPQYNIHTVLGRI